MNPRFKSRAVSPWSYLSMFAHFKRRRKSIHLVGRQKTKNKKQKTKRERVEKSNEGRMEG